MTSPERLLRAGVDPAPVEVVAASGRPDILLVCEHAGRAVPEKLGDLGVAASEMERHIAYDVGAEPVARALAQQMGATLILQRYSRLVIDCNRPPLGEQSIPEISDGTPIPANKCLSAAERQARVADIFAPYDAELRAQMAALPLTAAFSIHSFTPTFGGTARPWHIGFCGRDVPAITDMAEGFAAANPALVVGVNEPYRIDDTADWFIPQLAEPSGLRHGLIEIRNDTIPDIEAARQWADRLTPFLMEPT